MERETRKLERTKDPGIFKRGSRYVVIYRDRQGRQRKQATRTLAEAREVRATRVADVKRGEDRSLSRVTFKEYAQQWLETYGGSSGRGIRPETRAEYRRRLEQDAIPVLGRLRISEIEARDLDALAAHVAARGVSASTVRLALAPVKAMLGTAHRRGEIRWNPAAGYRTTYTQAADTGKHVDVRALDEEQLAALVAALPERWRLFFDFLARTGLRIGEAIELRWGDIDLGTGTLKVSRRFYLGSVASPKSKYGRRTIRLSKPLAQALWRAGANEPVEALVFTSNSGDRIDASNLMGRVLKPAAVAAGLGEMVKTQDGVRPESWVGFHTFRHTCATMLFRSGWNAVQVQRFLGHHRPSFTLDTYVHLLDTDLPVPTFTYAGGNTGATRATETDRNDVAPVATVSA